MVLIIASRLSVKDVRRRVKEARAAQLFNITVAIGTQYRGTPCTHTTTLDYVSSLMVNIVGMAQDR